MKIKAKYYFRSSGFTVAELVVAVAIILVLVSLIMPALNMVRTSADMSRQRAQFHSIDIALEAFRADFGDYPLSEDSSVEAYPGAQKLAEALIGQDGFGFHPKSEFRRNGMADCDGDGTDDQLYLPEVADDIDNDADLTSDQKEAAKKENPTIRKGPYLELETANAVRLGDIYKTPLPNGLWGIEFVLCDMFRVAKNNTTGKRTGQPILYYKADTSKFKHDPQDYTPLGENIYNHQDNWRVAELQLLWEGTVLHPMRYSNPDGPALFYKNTLNPNFPPNPPASGRPYRADSYILLSAGPDGLYGTADDVFNFSKSE
ncbi:MAG: type II secretion system protein [Planctomycetota bacterium]|jgi:type II secretory pathway pseudopilin PulG